MIVLVCRAGDDEIINGSPFFVCKSTPNSFIWYTYWVNIDLSYKIFQTLLYRIDFFILMISK